MDIDSDDLESQFLFYVVSYFLLTSSEVNVAEKDRFLLTNLARGPLSDIIL